MKQENWWKTDQYQMLLIKAASAKGMYDLYPTPKMGNGKISLTGEGWKANSYHAIILDTVKNTMKYSSFKPFANAKAIETSPMHVKFEGSFSKNILMQAMY